MHTVTTRTERMTSKPYKRRTVLKAVGAGIGTGILATGTVPETVTADTNTRTTHNHNVANTGEYSITYTNPNPNPGSGLSLGTAFELSDATPMSPDSRTYRVAHADTVESTGKEPIYTDADTPVRGDGWNQLQYNRVYIYYRDGYEDDAEQIREYVAYAEEYVHERIEINPEHEVELYVIPGDEYRDSKWTMTTNTEIVDGEFHSLYIDLIAPRDHDGIDPVNEDVWYRHGITHEYFQIPMFRIANQHYDFHGFHNNIPRWFRQGLPNWVAVYGTPPDQNSYSHRIENRVEGIQSGCGEFHNLNLDDDVYTIGTILVDWMVDEWGWDTVVSVLRTPVDSWSEALDEVFGVTEAEFEERWLTYAAAEYDSPVDPANAFLDDAEREYDASCGASPPPSEPGSDRNDENGYSGGFQRDGYNYTSTRETSDGVSDDSMLYGVIFASNILTGLAAFFLGQRYNDEGIGDGEPPEETEQSTGQDDSGSEIGTSNDEAGVDLNE